MPLVEAVTIELGTAIAKSILKIWLKDSTLGNDISSSLIDLLKTHTSDILAQRRGQRQFETIGEMIGANLLPIFEQEGTNLDDGAKTAVALAVRDAINTLSSSLLAANDLDPTELTKYLLNSYPPENQHFSATESELYRRIIQLSCPYLVDIASQLPTYNERTFAEVLKRETLLIERADQVLEEARRIREWLGPTEAGRFEEDYCKTVARKLDELQLFGTDVSSASKRHRLSVAYITLSVEQKIVMNNSNTLEIIKDTYKGSDDQDKESERVIVTIDTALTRSHYLLISGAAGSGKTTLLNWIAVNSALKTFVGALSHWNKTIPFYIRLRSLTASNLPKPEAFPGLIAPLIADTMPHGWVHTQLQSGNAIVLIDGVDEVATQQREEVRNWLKDMIETYPHAYFIVTSRPHAIEESWTSQQNFQLAELQPLQLSDIYTFIDHWHQAVRLELREEEEKVELIPQAEQLKADIKRNRSLYNLASNPLLCAMLCALNRDRRQQLPTDRIELYEACIYLLLERRDKERHVDLSEYPELNYRQKRVLLEDLAYWMIKNNLSETTLGQVDERFERKLKDMPGITGNSSGSSVRRLFVERSGLIREAVAKRIDFTHRTFEEFLAAKAAIDEVDIGLLIEKAQNDQWREVIILACGLATKQMREELINGLVDRGDNEEKNRIRLYLLAVSCLETSIELGQTTRTKVEQRLSKLVPPKSMTEARDLAAAGEIAVPYLFKKEQYPVSVTISCIRALSLIASDSALQALKEYTNDSRSSVIAEFFRAWDAFDKETFAKHVLSKIMQEKIRLEGLRSLSGFQFFTNLSSLGLSNCKQITDLSPLATLTQLSQLDLSYCTRISDLSPLANLQQLTKLDLSNCKQINDLGPLANLTQLASLNLTNCTAISDLDPLINLTQLTSLNLAACRQLNNLSPLANLIHLQFLDLTGCSAIADLTFLTNLTELTLLNLSFSMQVSDLNFLKNLKQLTSLSLPHCMKINDLSPLSGLIRLTSLNLPHCVQVSDLSPLANLAKLNSLNLPYATKITDLKPLKNLIHLTSLDLSYCTEISDLSPLVHLRHLKSLKLAVCKNITDLNALRELKQLQFLDLSYCTQVNDLTPLANLKRLVSLNVTGDKLNIDSLRGLKNLTIIH